MMTEPTLTRPFFLHCCTMQPFWLSKVGFLSFRLTEPSVK